jgi:hypothetical protein
MDEIKLNSKHIPKAARFTIDLERDCLFLPDSKSGRKPIILLGCRHQAGLLIGVRLHDLRHAFASYGAGGGLGLPMIGRSSRGHREICSPRQRSASAAHIGNDTWPHCGRF